MSVTAKDTEGLPELRLTEVNLYFDDSFSLKDIAFSVAQGESVALIGPSGSGKTVTLKTISGLFRPDSGQIEVRGNDVVGLDDTDRDRMARMGMLFQRSALFDSLPVWENITFRPRHSNKLTRTDAIDLALHKLAAVGLAPDTAFLYPGQLSGGMQKRVGIARALADDPHILLLDEPTAGLDPVMSNVINDLILENVQKLGATALSVTSNLDSARYIADRIIMLHEGQLVWQGPVTDLETVTNPYVDQFVHKTPDGPIRNGFS